jgi:glycosyltransferase involved in cell wall biosynthesis
VVDDGSTDLTSEIARKYPVKLLRQRNSGPATARNLGAKNSSGEIILFTDADCIAEPNWIEEMTSPFKDKEVIAVKGAYKRGKGNLVMRFVQIEFEERYVMLSKLNSIDMIDTYSAAFRRNIFMEYGGFDTNFTKANNEDTELSYRLVQTKCRMVFNPKAKVYHTGHPNTIFKYFKLKLRRGFWRVIVYKRFPDKILTDTYTPKTLKFQVLSSILSLLHFYFFYAFLTFLFLFLISSNPFIRFSLKKDTSIALLAPFFLMIRATAIGLGSVYGFVSNPFTSIGTKNTKNRRQ